MLENVLEVGERPEDLIVYAALGKAARDWDSYHRIVDALCRLEDDQTLVIQSGKPIGVFASSRRSPVVVMACSNLVGRWATPEHFYAMADRGLTMWGGLTAGDWQYIGSQGVLQGTYEILVAVAREHFDGSLAGRLVVTAGLGGMGSAQPLAIRMTGAVGLVVEVDAAKLERRAAEGYLSAIAPDLDAALAHCREAQAAGQPLAVGIHGNAAELLPELVRRGVVPDVVTDQTAAHDALYGYVPAGLDLAAWAELRSADPGELTSRARESMAAQVDAMLALKERGAVVLENGNNLRVQAEAAGISNAFDIDGFAERYLRPLFCRGIGPARWVALSGDPADVAVADALAATATRDRPEVAAWLTLAARHVRPQGLPARSCWLGHGERSRVALAVTRRWPTVGCPLRCSSPGTTLTRPACATPASAPSACSTGPSRSPTGPSSTRSSCVAPEPTWWRSTPAGAATRASCRAQASPSWLTGPRPRPNACPPRSTPTRGSACSATPMPATRTPPRRPRSQDSA